MATNESRAGCEALDRARRKAYKRLIPLLFISYVIAYIDRVNVAFAKLTMSKDMSAFDNDVIGTGAGLFFLGYFLLEIPDTIIVEKWSARKWIARIMITVGNSVHNGWQALLKQRKAVCGPGLRCSVLSTALCLCSQ